MGRHGFISTPHGSATPAVVTDGSLHHVLWHVPNTLAACHVSLAFSHLPSKLPAACWSFHPQAFACLIGPAGASPTTSASLPSVAVTSESQSPDWELRPSEPPSHRPDGECSRNVFERWSFTFPSMKDVSLSVARESTSWVENQKNLSPHDKLKRDLWGDKWGFAFLWLF